MQAEWVKRIETADEDNHERLFHKPYIQSELNQGLGKGIELQGKTVSVILLFLLVISALTLPYKVQPAWASGTIYIRADGSIDPPTAPISTADNITYTLTGNINSSADGIIIERDSIVVNGAGYAVQGTGAYGIDLSTRNNVTIKNANVRGFSLGIFLESSQNSVLIANNVTSNQYGIYLHNSSPGNNVSGNNAQNNSQYGIILYGCSGNYFSNNNVANNGGAGGWGIALFYSSTNSIVGNNITSNPLGLYLDHSSTINNSIYENRITNSSLIGIFIVDGASYNKFYHNNFIGNSVQASIGAGCVGNAWNDTYPSGGNYWSNYTGVDNFSGPNQDQFGSDGIGDAPYIIDANDMDHYPLMEPYLRVPLPEPQTIEWNRTYGGAGDDCARSVVQTMDGGFALAGYTNSYGAGGYDFWLVKTDAVGNVQWNQTYGTPGDDWCYSAIQTNDGGYALAGHSYYGGFHGLLVKTDEFGQLRWSKTYVGPYPGGASLLYSVVQTNDGGYALAGYTYTGAGPYDFWLVKTDASGNVQWSNTYGGAGNDIAYSVIQTNDGGYALAGYTTSYGAGKGDFFLVKTYPNGTLQGWMAYGGAGDDIAQSVIQTNDGGYALAGYTDSYGSGGTDGLLIKTDEFGHMEWNNTCGGANDDHIYSVVQTPDGMYLMAGDTSSYGAGQYDSWLVMANESGTMLWNMTFGGAGNENAYSVVLTSDGGYIACSQSKPSALVPEETIAVKILPDYTYTKKKIAHTLYGKDLDLEVLDQINAPYFEQNITPDLNVMENWCAPTAAAACLAWFAEANPKKYGNLIPGLNPEGKSEYWDKIRYKYLVAQGLGQPAYMNTHSSGTTDENFLKGLKKYITDKGLGGAFTVTPYWNPSFNEIRDEFKKGEDVIVGIRDGDVSHMVVLRGIDDKYNVYNPEPRLSFMDPMTPSTHAAFTQCHVIPNLHGMRPVLLSENCDLDGNGNTTPYIDMIVSVSPTPGKDPPEGPTPKDVSSTSDDTLNGTVVVSSGVTYVITGTDFNEVYIIGGTVYGVIGGTVYNTTGTVYGFANGTVSIAGGTYFPVTGSAYIINGSQAQNMPLISLHDVGVTDVQPFETVVGRGSSLSVNVTVDDGGNQNETFYVTAYANATLTQRQTITLTCGNFTTITFTWNTNDFAIGNYTVGAYAWPVPSETDMADNTFVDGVVQIIARAGSGGGGGVFGVGGAGRMPYMD